MRSKWRSKERRGRGERADDPARSCELVGLSFTLPYLEPYLIRTMRVAAKEIDDPELRGDVKAFSGQEAQHYKNHASVNDIVRRQLSPDAAAGEYYADTAARVSRDVLNSRYDRAILVCGTGIGVCISANKVPGVRAALTHDTYSAERAALSNNAQIITMGARVIGPELAKAIVDTWLPLEFDPMGKSAANVAAIDALDES